MNSPGRPTQASKPERPNGRVALGLMLIGTGRPAGFAQFGGSDAAFLASLAPLLGFLLVFGGALAASGHVNDGLTAVLSGVCDFLAPAVIADLFCRRWQRRQHWALYANVLNFAQWLMFAVLLMMWPLASVALSIGLSLHQASMLVVASFGLYVMWFHWFTARHVLDLSRRRAVLVMVAVVFGSGLLLQVPPWLAGKKIGASLLVVPDVK